jgi:Fic family protein/plasmid maintenance system antidote protein VapI
MKGQTIGTMIRVAREQHGATLKDIARLISIDTALLSKIERGLRRTTREQVLALAAHFGQSQRDWMVQWLSEKILYELEGEELAYEALKVAEAKVPYGLADSGNVQDISERIQRKLAHADQLKQQLDELRHLDSFRIAEALELEYTYESNKIEGNTMTLRETDLVISKGLTIQGKSMQEHLEAINHHEAIAYLKDIVGQKLALSERLLLDMHGLILRGIQREDAGKYRTVQVFIKGSNVVFPQPYLVPKKVEEFFEWYELHKEKLHPIVMAAEVHERVVSIHPFIDGNGRTSRLLMNMILLSHGYVIAIIRGDTESRLSYYEALESVQMSGSREAFIEFIADTEIASLEQYLRIIRGEA